MAIITISRGSYSKGKQVAEEVAKELGYEVVSRDVLLEASENFNIPEIKLKRALHDAPSILNRFTHGKQRYVAYIENAFLEHMQKDNVVYHGLAGQFFLKGVAHAVKVRILADLEDRVRLEMQRENISRAEALQTINKDDQERHKWSLNLYGMDTMDPSLYDLTIHIHKFTVADAVEMICRMAKLPQFQTTPESRKMMENLVLASRVKVVVVEKRPDVQVTAADGEVTVHTEAPLEHEPALTTMLRELAGTVPGVKTVKVHIRPPGL